MPSVADPDAQDPPTAIAVGPEAPSAAGGDAATSAPLLRAHAQLAAAGDSTAAQALVGELQPGVRRLAMAMTGNAQDAEEVVQETFLRLVRNIAQYRGTAEITTWVHRIAVNVALMRTRAQRRRPWDAARAFGRSWEHGGAALAESDDASPLLGGLAMGTASAWAQRPDQGAQGREIRQKIQAAASALPDRYRMVFVLRDVEGHGNEVVAEMLGLTIPTVKARLHRARNFMRHALRPYLEPGGRP